MRELDKWTLPTVSEVLAFSEAEVGAGLADLVQPLSPAGSSPTFVPDTNVNGKSSLSSAQEFARAEQQWFGTIAALNALLLHRAETSPDIVRGLVLSAPSSPVIHPILAEKFSTWMFTTSSLETLGWLPFQLLPGEGAPFCDLGESSSVLPLLPLDPLTEEQFCLICTPKFSLVIALGQDRNNHFGLRFSFDPHTIQAVWQILRPRVLLTSPQQINRLDTLFQEFSPTEPDYRIVTQLSRFLLDAFPSPIDREDEYKRLSREDGKKQKAEHFSEFQLPLTPAHSRQVQATSATQFASTTEAPQTSDMELLRAIAHEVRTPLATIRTLTRSLLKRQDLHPTVVQRLEKIDRECSEQIDRFGLIFKAVELETSAAKHVTMPLAATPLDQVFQQGIPRWQQQASQRNLNLEVLLPQQMPTVVSDPTVLDQALTGLIERFTRNLPSGSHIQVEVTPAGEQLKLQLRSFTDPGDTSRSSLKALGQLLSFQPETGSLSLSMAVTKNLFQALGGKLIVRQKPQQGEVLTIFLPLERSSLGAKSSDIRII